MKKKRNSKNNRLDMFKKRKVGYGKGHPAYIYQRIGDKYKYIGLTSNDEVKFKSGEVVKTIKLVNNPEPGNKENSYIMPYYEERSINDFGKRYNNWKFSNKDKKLVNKIKKIKKS